VLASALLHDEVRGTGAEVERILSLGTWWRSRLDMVAKKKKTKKKKKPHPLQSRKSAVQNIACYAVVMTELFSFSYTRAKKK
jgi:hypothetical protein